jgi:cystine transport system substrate-binding protein
MNGRNALKQALFAGLALVLGIGAADAADLAAIKEKGVITALTTANDKPNAYMDDTGTPTGFEIEMCNYFADKLGVKLDLGVIAWEGILPSLQAGRADIICSAVNITKARMETFDFSVPYSRTNIVAVVPLDSTVTGPTDLAGRVVGGVTGADGEDIIREIGGYKDIRVYAGLTEMMGDLMAGRIDVAITGDIQAGAFIKERPEAGKIVGDPYKTNFVGTPMTAGSAELQAALNQAIADARADGTIDALAEKYFGLANFTATLPPVGEPAKFD